MKKKIVSSILIIVVSVMILLLVPFIVPIKINCFFSDYVYRVHGTYAEIYEYKGNRKEECIPKSILFRPITVIDTRSFFYNDTIEKIIIGDKVHIIRGTAVTNCDNLKEVVMKDNVEYIEEAAFAKCPNLRIVKLSNNTKCIGDSAFRFCSNLKEIELPKTVEYIGNDAFAKTGIENITLPEIQYYGRDTFRDTPWLKGQGEFVITSNNSLIGYNGDDETVVIPQGIESICVSFSEQKKIYIPNTVKQIRARMVNPYSVPVEIYIPESVINIDEDGEINVKIGDLDKTTIITTSGSWAEKYAKTLGYNYKIVDHIAYPTE